MPKKQLPDELQDDAAAMNAAQSKGTERPENVLDYLDKLNPFPNGDELRAQIHAAHADMLAQNNAAAEVSGSTKKATSIPPYMIASLLLQYVPMYRTSDDDGAIIYAYDPDEGIYTGNPVFLQRLTQMLEPRFDEAAMRKVRYRLQALVPARTPDSEPNLVPVGNGIFNYETKELEPYTPKKFFISKAVTNYVPDAPEPAIKMPNGKRWKPSDLIKSLACNDAEVEHLLYEVIADAVHGNYSRGQAIFLLGSRSSNSKNGNNGKGTYEDLVRDIVGAENVSGLTVKDMENDFAAYNLLGKTCNIGDDLQANTFVDNSSRFNSAVTGDVIWTDVKGQKGVSFRFRGAFIQSTNEMPRFRNRTGGTYRRLVIVPFNAHFQGSGDNKAIKNDYIHRQSVREWYLSKALAIPFFDRLTVPKIAQEQLSEYMTDNDPVRQFIDDVLVPATASRFSGDFLFDLYKSWADDSNIRTPMQKRTFLGQLYDTVRSTEKVKTELTADELNAIKDDPAKLSSILPFLGTPSVIGPFNHSENFESWRSPYPYRVVPNNMSDHKHQVRGVKFPLRDKALRAVKKKTDK